MAEVIVIGFFTQVTVIVAVGCCIAQVNAQLSIAGHSRFAA